MPPVRCEGNRLRAAAIRFLDAARPFHAKSSAGAIFLFAFATTAMAQEPPRFSETVSVRRLLLDVRVVDAQGRAIPNLEPDDFRVRVDGRPARVESAEWIGDASIDGYHDRAPLNVPQDARGRLVVILVQKSLEPKRVSGLLRLLHSTRLLDAIGQDDRVAVLSFDQHLRIWVDFTNDRQRVRRALTNGVLFGRDAPGNASSPPSLLARLDRTRAKRIFSVEEALLALGEALDPLPGSKSVVVIGYGFGRLGFTGVHMTREYDAARDALNRARAALFCLDVTAADYHSLEKGLQLAAADTGGFYARTHEFAEQAIKLLDGALSGQYVLFVEAQESSQSAREVQVELTRRDAVLLYRKSASTKD